MLQALQSLTTPIRVGLAGAGCMGMGIARQIAHSPGMELTWVADLDPERARQAARLGGNAQHGTSSLDLLAAAPVDAFVEASTALTAALESCQFALASGSHVVLMNAEVDLVFGPELQRLAAKHGRVVTSDAGDQHGVLATMIEEIRLWGFHVVQAGNIKGYLRRDATAESLREEAAKRRLDPIQCCSYTDGTKLNIEMALLCNGLGFLPTQVGMAGPKAERVEEALELFDFSLAGPEGSVDYLLGAEPGGGVYVVATCDDAEQIPYLSYYKLGEGPFYLFSRPYHLCHLETPRAIAKAVLRNEAILAPRASKIAEVYAFAKRDLKPGTSLSPGMGGDSCYGLVAPVTEAESRNWLPITQLDLASPPSSWHHRWGAISRSPKAILKMV